MKRWVRNALLPLETIGYLAECVSVFVFVSGFFIYCCLKFAYCKITGITPEKWDI